MIIAFIIAVIDIFLWSVIHGADDSDDTGPIG